jgi:glycine cleavage system transcriptional repressor
MKKVVISVLGQDRPGIIAKVSKALFFKDCNIENVSQTIIQAEFSGIFIVAIPDTLTVSSLQAFLEAETAPLNLHFYIKTLETTLHEMVTGASQPFVVCTQGPDRKGLVAAITGVMAEFRVNVTHLQAIFEGGDDPDKNIMIYQVDIPLDIDKAALDGQLRKTAASMGLQISIQHRNIFEAINRI